MERNKSVKKYELVLIVDAKLTNEAKDAVRKEAADLINANGGKVINIQVWLEKHKLTFNIKKCDEGTYYIINFEGGSDVVKQTQQVLKINENILRFAFIKVEPKPEVKRKPEAAHV